jgi:hypothetical protein
MLSVAKKPTMLNVVMLNVVMLSEVMLNVVMLSVVMLNVVVPKRTSFFSRTSYIAIPNKPLRPSLLFPDEVRVHQSGA